MVTVTHNVLLYDDQVIDDALLSAAYPPREAFESFREAEAETMAKVGTVLSWFLSLPATWILCLCAIAGAVAFHVDPARNRHATPSITPDIRYDAFYIQPHHH